MAGRGTDIQLGGNLDMLLKSALKGDETQDQVTDLKRQIKEMVEVRKQKSLAAGGLYVLGTERHESRRIDNQLRGRTGRQGDPGKSKFYICLEDDLLRIFALETSQRRVEQRNFEIRKNLLKFDDVVNDQRKVVFEQRIEFMRVADVSPIVRDMRHEIAEGLVNRAMPEKAYAEQWDISGLVEMTEDIFGIYPPVEDWAREEGIVNAELADRLKKEVDRAFAARAAALGPERMRWIEKQVLLQVLDVRWREHLSHLDHLRSVIHLRGYAQRDPLNEYKSEAFSLFERMLMDLRTTVTRSLMRLQVEGDEATPPAMRPPEMHEIHADPHTGANEMDELVVTAPPMNNVDPTNPATWGKTARNALCPCGSGKKYKHCHGDVGAQSAQA
jgi:preprotein translocase subunit SecA